MSHTTLPALGVFSQRLAPMDPRHRAIRGLHSILTAKDPGHDVLQRQLFLERLAGWVGSARPLPLSVRQADQGLTEASEELPQTRRLRFLLTTLEAFPSLQHRLSSLIQGLLQEQSATSFLARIGIPGDGGLFSETVDRLSRRLMPQPLDEQDVTQVVAYMFPVADVRWLAQLPADLVHAFTTQLKAPKDEPAPPETASTPMDVQEKIETPALGQASLVTAGFSVLAQRVPAQKSSIWSPLRVALLEAILLLAARVSSAGLSDVIRARSPVCAIHDSPFFKLPRTIDALLATPRTDHEVAAQFGDSVRALLTESRETARSVETRLESFGVSVDVVYRLELIDRSLRRIEDLLALLLPQRRDLRTQRAVLLMAQLLGERHRDLSLTDIARTNLRLLARKIIERAGQTGEHYITVTRAAWFKMMLSAAGGGLLTAGTTASKFWIGWMHRPPFQEGLLASINYGGSFMLMQICGFTLATKQPSVTAAALAGTIKKVESSHSSDALVTTIARLTRTQLAAAFGNIGMVIPACMGVDMLARHLSGAPFLDEKYAHKTLASLHPTESGTIAFAALTGVLLWASSIAAGWLENWAVYRRIPEAIAEHRIRRFVGDGIMLWVSRVFARNIAGVGGNVAIGLMLGMMPVFGTFIGLPLEVRHVTLSTGALTLSVSTLGQVGLAPGELRMAVIGILVIFVLNLAVSFGLALAVALRARQVPSAQLLNLVRALIVGFFRSPLRFFWPPKGEVEPAH